MSVEPITPEHFAIIQGWWLARDLGVMSPDILPPAGVVAVGLCGCPLAAAWLYEPAGCKVAFLDWLVTRPGMPPTAAREACRAVFGELEVHARDHGFTHIFASIERDQMLREVKACGFTIAATGCTHLVKHL